MNHLGPKLEADGKGDLKILGYDQNREHLKEWVDDQCIKMKKLQNILMEQRFIGMQVRTIVFPKTLQYAHNKAPNKLLDSIRSMCRCRNS